MQGLYVLGLFGGGMRHVQSEPGFIVRPIAWLFGTILDFMFQIASFFTYNNSLGIAIILLTVVAMTMMLPLNIKAQKSMIKMQQLNPEIEKIKAKYGSKNDAETKQKIAAETQALWAKHKVNPLGSCLPMLIQMPLFFALLYIMNQSYLYIDTLSQLYYQLSEAIQAVPGYLEILRPLARPHIPDAWYYTHGQQLYGIFNSLVAQGVHPDVALQTALIQLDTTDVIVLSLPEHLSRVLDRFTLDSWNALFAEIRGISPARYTEIQTLFARKQEIEVFVGLPLKQNSGWTPPGVIIPILAVITTMATSWLSQLVNKAKDQQQRTMQTVMMTVMPLFMGFVTVGFPAGVGLYWVVSNLYRLVQQIIMNKKAGVVFRLPFSKKEA
ncbi:MAG: YidC/Oxa1 family membrane protein insertase [Defluviitaleaceae bacterium]|nr:YidC/Oxa1 family membrane protein insertase [Defluviitaleaceae bacterium]MCL2204315.1 YidC/Oxa1 family membrane protein insertase [Defluviitaleaceae bacterium]MCL2240471.1 YidC/Oxa1 family membrane protein insertase [Defluviitaleaceae bacterium]